MSLIRFSARRTDILNEIFHPLFSTSKRILGKYLEAAGDVKDNHKSFKLAVLWVIGVIVFVVVVLVFDVYSLCVVCPLLFV
jgi:hypothetical protein